MKESTVEVEQDGKKREKRQIKASIFIMSKFPCARQVSEWNDIWFSSLILLVPTSVDTSLSWCVGPLVIDFYILVSFHTIVRSCNYIVYSFMELDVI